MQNYCNTCCRIHTRRCSSGGHFSIILTAVNAHNALARNAKTQTRPFCAVVTDHLAFLEVKRLKCLFRTLVPFFKNSNCRFFVVMVFGWLCGGHAGLRQRLEHQEHGFDKSNFCLESLPNMTDFPNHRWTLSGFRLRTRSKGSLVV